MDFVRYKPELKIDYKSKAAPLLQATEYYESELEELSRAGVTFEVEPDRWSILLCEFSWFRAGRPYYNIYPCIAEMAAKIPDDTPVRPFRLPHVPRLLPPFAENASREKLEECDTYTTQALELRQPDRSHLLIVQYNEDTGNSNVSVWSDMDDQTQRMQRFPLSREDPETLGTLIGMNGAPLINVIEKTEEEHVEDEIDILQHRLVACLGLLVDGDLGLLERDVCKRDEGKPLTDDVIKRAEKRKGQGWSLGRTLESTPHTRRPHFGIRHMREEGHEDLVPRLRPIKGSVVRGKKMTEIPTGFEDK